MMNKQDMTDALQKNYRSFVTYLQELTAEEYAFSFQEKWTAAQQLEHLILSVKPLVKVFGMGVNLIGQSFGRTDRESRSYEGLKQEYMGKLSGGGKAPEQFAPKGESSSPKETACETLISLVSELCTRMEGFTERELDMLLVPHPLLGNLTLREMLYNAIYHVEHHQNLTIQYLKNK